MPLSTESPAASTQASTAASPKRDTIARVLKMARLEFSEKGLAGARVDDIARAAGVTKQLVYHYFASKERLFASVLDESADRITSELLALELDHLPPPDALRSLLQHAFDQYRDDPALGALATQGLRYHEDHVTDRTRFAVLAPALAAQMARVLQRGVDSGDFRPEVDARLFHAAAALLTTGAFTNRYTVSAIAGFDTTSADGMEAWREFSVNFVLSTVMQGERPSLRRRLPIPDANAE
jgi:AcrR family transcriptional regulator